MPDATASHAGCHVTISASSLNCINTQSGQLASSPFWTRFIIILFPRACCRTSGNTRIDLMGAKRGVQSRYSDRGGNTKSNSSSRRNADASRCRCGNRDCIEGSPPECGNATTNWTVLSRQAAAHIGINELNHHIEQQKTLRVACGCYLIADVSV